ncbi:hypothetical protein ACHQM5_023456 [Ranunculus cassubicifolius]
MAMLLRVSKRASLSLPLINSISKSQTMTLGGISLALTQARRCMSSSMPIGLLRLAKEYQLGEAKDKNFVLSPCSIQLVISLLANGAKGSTANELLKFLEAENLLQVNSIVPKLVQTLTESTTGEPKISSLTGLWVDQSLRLNPKFKTDAENNFKARAEYVDFQDKTNAKEAMYKVNEWAKKATNGLIKSVIPEGSFGFPTGLVVANALYFKGTWAKTFQKSFTKDYDFYLSDGNSVQVPFMRSRRDQFIETSEDFKILRMPYKSTVSDVSMYIILPEDKNGLRPLLEKVSSDPLFLTKHLHKIPKEVKVGTFLIPKFKFNYNLEASDVLKTIGVTTSFTRVADFGDMVQGLNHGEWLQLSELHHDCRIEVDEEGTVAAARNVWMMNAGRARQQPVPRVDFVADHPFMYMVRDDVTGMVLFMGHVVNPGLEN